jgi:hypothetical protein
MQEHHATEEEKSDPSSKGPRYRRIAFSALLIIGLVVLNRWLFRVWFDLDYFRWYLDNGALFSIVFGFVGLAGARPDESLGLISLNPQDYVVAVFSLTSWPLLAASAALDSSRYGRSIPNSLLLVPLSFALLAGVGLFLIVGAPLQYFIHAVCGAPGRVMRDAAGVHSYWIVSGDKVRMEILKSPKGELPEKLASYREFQSLHEELSKLEAAAEEENVSPEALEEVRQIKQQADEVLRAAHVTEVQFENKPLALTSAFSSLVLWIAGQFI